MTEPTVATPVVQDEPLEGRPPIIVSGLPRNGTTLVGRLLGSHSEIALPPGELGFFNVLWQPTDPPDRTMQGRAEFDRRLQRLLARIAPWGLPEDEVLEAAREVAPTYRDLFVFLLDLYRRRVGKPRAGEKTVNYQQWLHVLDAWFEDYRFVHVVRDPVDAFASVKWFRRGTPRPNKVDLIPWMHEWNESAALALHRSHARPDRYCLVRYEDVVARPVEVLRRVCEVVGVAPEPERMLEMTAGEATESSFVDESGRVDYEGRIRRSDEVDRSQRIEPRELEAIRSVCAPLAHLLGYDVAPLRTRRASVGQPAPGRIPLKVAVPFLAARVLGPLRRLARPLVTRVREWRRSRGWRQALAGRYEVIFEHSRRFGLRTLVETGTLFGDTIVATRRHFDRVYSIELSPELHTKARRRLRRFRNVTLLQGDSAEVLPQLLDEIDEPCLFWLDAHYSGGVSARAALDSPLRAELAAILAREHDRDVILIDDASYLSGERGWPTWDELRDLCDEHGLHISEADRIVRIHR